MREKPYTCKHCGRLDPFQAVPCYCQKTTMQTKEKDVRLVYEHLTDGHPFGVSGCPSCNEDRTRHA